MIKRTAPWCRVIDTLLNILNRLLRAELDLKSLITISVLLGIGSTCLLMIFKLLALTFGGANIMNITIAPQITLMLLTAVLVGMAIAVTGYLLYKWYCHKVTGQAFKFIV
ncbi:MAG: hypothetical protein ACI9WC_003539 [Arenicella sp.]